MRTVYLADHTKVARPPQGIPEALCVALREGLEHAARSWYMEDEFTVKWGLPQGTQVYKQDLVVVLEDTSDYPGALAYHYTNGDGSPAAKVFTKTILDNRGTWITGPNSVSTAADHETKETLGDVSCNYYAYDGVQKNWCLELCDAVEATSYKASNGVHLSNYALPAYFNPQAQGPYDKMGLLNRPFGLLKGGYSIVSAHSKDTAIYARGILKTDEGTLQVAHDPTGGSAVIIADADYPKWKREIKLDPSNRTYRRIVAEQ